MRPGVGRALAVREKPRPEAGRGVGVAQSPLGLRLRDQMRV